MSIGVHKLGASKEVYDVYNREGLASLFDDVTLEPNTQIRKAEEVVPTKVAADVPQLRKTSSTTINTPRGPADSTSSRRQTTAFQSGVTEGKNAVDISSKQAGNIEEGREAMTTNYALFCRLRDKVLQDPTRRNVETSATTVEASEEGGGTAAASASATDATSAEGQASSPKKASVCLKFWEMIDGFMSQLKDPLGIGTVDISPANHDVYQTYTPEMQGQTLGRWGGAAAWLVEVDPYAMIQQQFTSRGLKPTFTAEEALEECLYAVHHGLFELQMGATCKRCTSSQVYAASFDKVPNKSVCPCCGLENTNDGGVIRVKFKPVQSVFYWPMNHPMPGAPSSLVGRVNNIAPMFPGGKAGAKYQYDKDLTPGDHLLMCLLTDTKIHIHVAGGEEDGEGAAASTGVVGKEEKKDDAGSTPTKEEPERLDVNLRASWVEGQRHTINVEHGRIRIKTVQDTSTVTFHAFMDGFFDAEELTVPEEEVAAFTTSNHVLNNPTFNRLFPGQVLGVEQEVEMGNAIICFTDLLDSTQQYSDLGDGVALRLVKDHFELLFGAIAEENGRVVKTIGDAVMCTFQSVAACVRAITKAMQAMLLYNDTEDCPKLGHMHLKTGIHKGPALMVPLNGLNDFFGQTVNIAARVQGKAEADEIVLSEAALADDGAQEAVALLTKDGYLKPKLDRSVAAKLKGVKAPVQLTMFEVVHPDKQDKENNHRDSIMNASVFRRVTPKTAATAGGESPGGKKGGSVIEVVETKKNEKNAAQRLKDEVHAARDEVEFLKAQQEEEVTKLPFALMSPEWQTILAGPLSSGTPPPSHLEDITSTFVDAALRRLYGPKMPTVESVQWKRNETQGLMSDSAVVKITYAKAVAGEKEQDGAGPEKKDAGASHPDEVFVKAAAKNSGPQEAQAFQSEVAFYSTVPSSVWSARPTCYFCEGTMVLLDRVSSSTTVQLPLFKPVDSVTVDSVLGRLAKMHAQAWPKKDAADDAPKPFATGLSPRSAMKGMLSMFVEGPLGSADLIWESFAENPEAPNAADYKRQLAAVQKSEPKSRAANLFDQLWYPKSTPDTFVFGDVKPDNMFVTNKKDLTFIDFGACAWGPGVADVSAFLLSSLSLPDFLSKWQSYLKQYHTALTKDSSGVTGYSLAQAEADFKGSIAASFLVLMYFAKRIKDDENEAIEKKKSPTMDKTAADKKEGKAHSPTEDPEKVAQEKAKAQTAKSVLWFVGRWVAVMEKLQINELVTAVKKD